MKIKHALHRINQLIGILLVTTTLSGCLGYRLGTTLPHDVQSIHIPVFENKTTEPLLQIAATDATIARFQFDGSVQIVENEEADAILEVALKSYTLTPLSYERDRTATTREYRATVYASVVVIRRSTDEVILDAPSVLGETTFYLTGDMTSSKRRAVPDLTENLARHIVETVTQTW